MPRLIVFFLLFSTGRSEERNIILMYQGGSEHVIFRIYLRDVLIESLFWLPFWPWIVLLHIGTIDVS